MEKTWTPNDTQKLFMKELANRENGATIFELKLEGKDFKTGTVNTLVSKGLVSVDAEKREYTCDVVYNGVKVGTVTKKGCVYRLVK